MYLVTNLYCRGANTEIDEQTFADTLEGDSFIGGTSSSLLYIGADVYHSSK